MSRLKIRRSDVTAGQAARILEVSYTTINRLCEEGILRARRVRPRGWWRIRYDSVIEYSSKISNALE